MVCIPAACPIRLDQDYLLGIELVPQCCKFNLLQAGNPSGLEVEINPDLYNVSQI
jgi:hypothetical protein